MIIGKSIQDALKVYTEQTPKAKNPARTQQAAGKRDEVVLSPKAQEFAQLLQKLKAMPDVRADKVVEFSERIEAGNYHVSAGAIAEKMLGGR
ncbi:MAG: flagellar biosynthesis anti-sigma factor FlgM [Sporomusaceae bacterium]|nr:flagellar biosynthesis anti-sigma factor FlgM [Sporomusaceae bacterium]